MDPVTAALLGGFTAGLAEVASQAVRDSYEALRDALVRRARRDPAAQSSLRAKSDIDGEDYTKELIEYTSMTDLSRDREIAQLARALTLALEESSQSPTNTQINVNVSGSHGVIVGDNATINQHFQS